MYFFSVSHRSVVVLAALVVAGAACRPAPPPADEAPAADAAPTDPWSAARARGIEFRAIGQEPGWLLEIDEGVSMRLLYDYGERTATVPASPPAIEDGRRTYTGMSDADSLNVVIEDEPCSDVMSGEAFPATVSVTINGRALEECGRALE